MADCSVITEITPRKQAPCWKKQQHCRWRGSIYFGGKTLHKKRKDRRRQNSRFLKEGVSQPLRNFDWEMCTYAFLMRDCRHLSSSNLDTWALRARTVWWYVYSCTYNTSVPTKLYTSRQRITVQTKRPIRITFQKNSCYDSAEESETTTRGEPSLAGGLTITLEQHAS